MMTTATSARRRWTPTNALTLSVEEARRHLDISRGLAYVLVNRGDIPSVHLGRRIVVPRRALERLLEMPKRRCVRRPPSFRRCH
jgi:excisionase family DNA binding protein